MNKRLRVLVFIPAYNAEKTIVSVLDRIPQELAKDYDVEILVIDDTSKDATWQKAKEHLATFWCPGVALRNPVNQGYGGNQKVGYQYAMEHNFDVVAMVHGDGQYAPECLPQLLQPFCWEVPPDAVYGSRMLHPRDAIKGGMPIYKFFANKFLTWLQNGFLGSHLSEFHSGYRLYNVSSLRELPIFLNSNGFDFDTEIIIQLIFSRNGGDRLVELPIPTFYGDEICHVNGLDYAWKILRTSMKARLIRMGIFYDPKFFFARTQKSEQISAFAFPSAIQTLVQDIAPGSLVVDLGCTDREVTRVLSEQKGCTVFTCTAQNMETDSKIPWSDLDYVLALDVLEEQDKPEIFLARLREKLQDNNKVQLLTGSANVGFYITRFMLLFGQFNYASRGILAMTHKRLFTKSSLQRTLRYAGFCIEKTGFMAGPYQRALGETRLARLLFVVNKWLMRFLPGLFAYQILVQAHPLPHPAHILRKSLR